MTVKFAFYQVCLTSKYNRIAPGEDQLTDFKFYIGPFQLIAFLVSMGARIVLNQHFYSIVIKFLILQ